MSVPSNILQNVITWQKADMAWMLNQYCGIEIANKKFKNFNKLTANLGDTVSWDLAPRSFTTYGLVANNLMPMQQRTVTMSCTQSILSSMAFTAQQLIFNVEDYMDRFGKSKMNEIGSKVESDLLKNITSSVTVLDPTNPNFGQIANLESGPYRFYGSADGLGGLQPINSYLQLAEAIALFEEYGAANWDLVSILPNLAIPAIANSALSQFVIKRNEDVASKWMVSDFNNCKWYSSTLLPIHYAGTVGNSAAPNNLLTLISTNDPSGQNITQLTLSGATPGDVNAIKRGDLMQIVDDPSYPLMRYLQFIGHNPSGARVQVRVTSDTSVVPPDGSGNVTLNIYPALSSTPNNANQNLNNALAAGMKFQVMPSHRAGVLMSGNPLYLAMPQLPENIPYPTVSSTDEETGVSIRHYWGQQGYGQNTQAYIHDCIWASHLVAENSMRLLFPL